MKVLNFSGKEIYYGAYKETNRPLFIYLGLWVGGSQIEEDALFKGVKNLKYVPFAMLTN